MLPTTKMPVNRLVAFIVGPAITLLAGYISLWLSRHFPGAHLPDQKSIAGVLTTGVLAIGPMILAHLKIQKWLTGWQSWEKQINDATNGALDASMQKFLEDIAAKTGVSLPADASPAALAGAPGDVPVITVDPSSSPAQVVDPPPAAQPGAFDGPNAPTV